LGLGPLDLINPAALQIDLQSYFYETFSMACALIGARLYQLGTPILNDRKPPLEGSPAYYRARAAEMLKMAEKAVTDDARSSYLQLAASWQQLAQKLEEPSW